MINNGESYRDENGVCVKGLFLKMAGENLVAWDLDPSVRACILRNRFINEHLEVWLALTPIERNLRDGLISPEQAQEEAVKTIARFFNV